jgi:NAD(P)-dependent dehydrogenase (short-subunit alcohol dehydrogenase family)
MTHSFLTGAAAMAFFAAAFSACTPAPEPQPAAEQAAERPLPVDSLYAMAEAYRQQIETSLEAPFELTTDLLRAKIKQKWSRIHFYTANGALVRVKTYPHEGISTRTEEFYFKDDALVAAVIEDDGSGGRGENPADFDKAYYFHNGALVKEINKGKEREYGIRNSDAEELLQEAAEYMDIFKATR